MKFKSSLSSIAAAPGTKMEGTNQPTCPDTVPTIRRNPPRKAKATPASIAPPSQASVSSTVRKAGISSFPIQDILSIEIAENRKEAEYRKEEESRKGEAASTKSETEACQNLKVFLRIRPSVRQSVATTCANVEDRAFKPKNARSGNHLNPGVKKKQNQQNQVTCITVNDCHSVTLTPPPALKDLKRTKSEFFSGFSRVFSSETPQNEIFEMMMSPLVEDFLSGRSGMLAALGPTGSGKTHTLFGTPRDPGMLPLVLRKIFKSNEAKGSKSSSQFYISMFEIHVERGKGERISDLCSEDGDVLIQQSSIKGLKEVLTSDIAQAESAMSRGLLKRATAMTKSNSQSSRSQCIINIRNACCCNNKKDAPVDTVLTIVDLAGAEREKRTGNQGARLLESNFINNTSMTFGLCLRSLLEYQKNQKKPLRRHFQNSLLTRHLRDYLEGKKRMALLLTVKPGESDYLDTSFLLRQASPYMNIRFCNAEEKSRLLSNKRQLSLVPKDKDPKRIRLIGHHTPLVKKKSLENEADCEGVLVETVVGSDQLLPSETDSKDVTQLAENEKLDVADCHTPDKNAAATERSHQILQNFSKALWNVLKQYNTKLQVAESEIESLKIRLGDEKKHSGDLENELRSLKSRCSCVSNILVPETSSSQLGTDSETSNAESSDIGCSIATVQQKYGGIDSGIGRSPFDDVVADTSAKQGSVFDCKSCELSERNADGSSEKREGRITLPDKNMKREYEKKENSETDDTVHDNAEDHNPIPNSRNSLSNGAKPRRRLLPVSSMLARDIGALGLEDEDDKPKGHKGDKKFVVNSAADKTQGSVSLLRLLSNNLHL